LRTAVGLTSVIQGGACLADRGNSAPGAWAVGLTAVASGALLLIGFLTPFAGILVGLGGIGVALSWLPAIAPNALDATLSVIFLVTMAIAIVLLGPGALSLDARLFGRREIIIPSTSRSPKY